MRKTQEFHAGDRVLWIDEFEGIVVGDIFWGDGLQKYHVYLKDGRVRECNSRHLTKINDA